MTEYHLGIYMGHDAGIAIVDDGLKIHGIFEEEKFNGEKMTYFNPYFSLRELVKGDLRHFRSITFGFNPDESGAKYHPKFVSFQKTRTHEVLNYLSHKISWDRVEFFGHHHCHAAGAFFFSGFERSLIMVADGTGESESTSFYLGEGSRLTRISTELTRDFSLGILYQYFTEWLGYRTANTSQHCGKIMGLSSYGRPVYKDKIRGILNLSGDRLTWPGKSPATMRSEIIRVFGIPHPRPTEGFSEIQADVAASVQALLEEIVLDRLIRMKERCPAENLCIAGGVGMNSLLNYRILKRGLFKGLFVQPLASDRGIALGAAAASAVKCRTASRTRKHPAHVYLGYDEKSLRTELNLLMDRYDIPVLIENGSITPAEIAGLLHKGQVLALFQGRQEAGPRALGNRSIITAPTVQSRDRVNTEVKYREPWRPFAPTVLEEMSGEYFDFSRPQPFMTTIYGVNEGRTAGIEGVVHVDGTARLQTVSPEQNPFFHSIVKAYYELTGTPILLNTSFNIKGQPIVRNLYDAVMTFLCSGIDGLLAGDALLRKTRTFPKEYITRLDRILYEVTKNTRSLCLRLQDSSVETEEILEELIRCPSVMYRKEFGKKPLAICSIKAGNKRSWDIISRFAPRVRQFLFDGAPLPPIAPDGIGLVILGKELIEAPSSPLSYVRFDRNAARDLIETCFQRPDRDRIFFLDREYHLFDIEYLHSRFESSEMIERQLTVLFHSKSTDELPGTRLQPEKSREHDIRREELDEAVFDS